MFFSLVFTLQLGVCCCLHSSLLRAGLSRADEDVIDAFMAQACAVMYSILLA